MTNVKNYEVWKNAEVAKNFLEGVRSAIPLAGEQIDCLLRVMRLSNVKVERFIDLGCGNGILGKAIQQQYPQARGIFVDISETALEAAKINCDRQRSAFTIADFATSAWQDVLGEIKSVDAIVSGFAIHHQTDERKKEIYQEIYDLLKPGGIFFNLEHVASRTSLGEKAFDELFVDSLYAYHQRQGSTRSRSAIDAQYYNRADKTANILSLVELQCDWLREIGFLDVDCYMKLFEIALFGGIKPDLQL
jgi:SAM-dependent methyltransferase